MQKLGKNNGRYHGETIDIDHVTAQIHQLALASGWHSDTFLHQPALRAYRRHTPNPLHRIYLSSGIHGDEPSGPLALLQLLAQNQWPAQTDIWLVPCLNPTGFHLNTRENNAGVDLNREYRHPIHAEVRAHIAWLEQQPSFDLTLILHEDWEASGFYVYELNPENRPSLAEPIIQALNALCPIEAAPTVDGWDCRAGIIRPHVPPGERPQWAEALYLITHKSPQSYTLETPSDYPLPLRVQAHVHAVKTVLNTLATQTV